MKHLSEALSKSQIKKIDRYDEYVVFWPYNFRIPYIIKYFPELKKYGALNPLQMQSKVYLIPVDLAKEIYKNFKAIDEDLDFYKVIISENDKHLSKEKLYDEIKKTIESGIEIGKLQYGEVYVKNTLGFKHIYNNEL